MIRIRLRNRSVIVSSGSGGSAPTLILPPTITSTGNVGDEVTWTPAVFSGADTVTTILLKDMVTTIDTVSPYVIQSSDSLSEIIVKSTATNAYGSTISYSSAVIVNEYNPPADIIPIGEIDGLVAWWDGLTYSGSGNWLNQASSGSALDVTQAGGTPPVYNGTNYWTMNNSGYFTGTNNQFMKDLHKSQSFTFWARYKTPDAAVSVDSIFGTASTTGNYGIEIRADSSGIPKIDQYNGGAAVTKQNTTVKNRSAASGDVEWTKGTGWSINTGTGKFEATAASSALSQTLVPPIVAGMTYMVTFTIDSVTAGSVQISLGGATGTVRSTAGTFSEDIVAGSDGVLSLTGTGFSGVIDNFDVRMAKNSYYTLVIKRDATAGQLGFSVGCPEFEIISDGWAASTTDPTYDFNLGSDGNNTNAMDNTARIYGMGFIDHAIDNEELAVLISSVEDYYTPPDPEVPTQAKFIISSPVDGGYKFNYYVSSTGGVPLTDTKIEYKLSSSGTWLEYSHSAFGDTFDVSITGLTNGSSYDFRLTPQNASGYAAAPSSTITGTPIAAGTAPYDFSYYKLTTPYTSTGRRAGSAVEVLQPAVLTYTGASFYRENGICVFKCPDGGAATATASSARSEFRHLTNIPYTTESRDCVKFSAHFYDNGAGTYPASQKTVTHQIHDAYDPWFKGVVTSPSTQAGTNGTYRILYKYLIGVRNQNFTTDTYWTKGAGWSIASGVATAATASSSLTATLSEPLTNGVTYKVAYTVTSYTSGSIAVNVGGTAGLSRTAAGTYEQEIVAGATGELSFVGSSFVGSIDNVRLFEANDRTITLKSGMADNAIITVGAEYEITATDGDFVTGKLNFYLDGNALGTTPDASTVSLVFDGSRPTYYWKRGNYFQPYAQTGWGCDVTHYTQSGQYVG